MSVTRMPRAPSSQSSSMMRLVSARGTIARTATQPWSCSGDTVGDSMPGVNATRRLDQLGADVVVHEHVAPGDDDALHPPHQLVDGRRVGAHRAAHEHCLGLQDRLPHDLQAGLPQRGAGRDDVGDRRRRPRAAPRSRPRRRGGSPRRRRRGRRSTSRAARRTTSRPACRRSRRPSSAEPGRAANRNVDSPKPSCRISSAGAPLSSSRSRPVMPTSSSPEPT